MEKKTPLYAFHLEHGGKMVPFAGYLLPVQYPAGLIAEHMAVRTAAGVFDVSHMGQLQFSGQDAEKNLQRLLCNDLGGMEPGRARYSPVLNERGGIVDDVVVFKHADGCYTLVVNAANREKDAAWFLSQLTGDAAMEDLSEQTAQLALQGPASPRILARIADQEKLPVKYYSFVEDLDVAGFPCLVSRTGYTGELGYEIYCTPEQARPILEALLEAGREDGLIPCGLGARDTLRLEASMPLYGHEMSEEITPLEANLGLFVKMDKGDFIGREALSRLGEPARTRIGLEITGRGIAREGSEVYLGERLIGQVTSGTLLPYLQKAMAMALVDKKALEGDGPLTVDVRGRRISARTVPLPFYRRT